MEAENTLVVQGRRSRISLAPHPERLGTFMSHEVQAFVLRGPAERSALEGLAQGHMVRLEPDFHLIPLTDELFDEIAAKYPGLEDDPYEVLWKFSGSTRAFAEALSKEGPVLYFETEYSRGVGGQSAAVWKDGKLALEPVNEDEGPINRGLELMGLVPKPQQDAFDTLGLGTCRDNDEWIARAAGEAN